MSGRKKRPTKRPARGSTKPAAGSGASRGGGPATTRRPSSPGQLPAGAPADGETPRPSGSSFLRNNLPATGAESSGAPSVRIPPPMGARGLKPVAGRSPVSAEALLSTSSASSAASAPARRAASAAPASAAPTTTLSPVRPPRLALRSGSTPVEVSSFTCRSLGDVEPQALGVTYWFDAAPDGDPYSFTVHISGRLRGEPPPGRQGTFTHLATVDGVVPGSGRVAVTTRVFDLVLGTWDVTATPVQRTPGGSAASWEPVTDARLPRGTASGTTTFGPLARVRAPGVRLWAWPALVGTGTVLALVVQSLLAPRLGLPVQRLLPLSLVACVLGLLGAKTYFLVTHPRERRSFLTPGMSVQGFVLVAIATLLGGSWPLDLPAGSVLDATAPSLLLGMTVGRLGCLLGGCCAGRPTGSRWGVWSSDRRMGVRRIPVQLLESSLAGVVGVLTLLAALVFGASAGGLVFVAGIAAYTAGRQVLFPLRGIPRDTAHGRQIMLVSSSLVALAATAALVLR